MEIVTLEKLLMISREDILLMLPYGAIALAFILVVVLIIKTNKFRKTNDQLATDLLLKEQEISQLAENYIQRSSEIAELQSINEELSATITELQAANAVAKQQQIDARRHSDEKMAI